MMTCESQKLRRVGSAHRALALWALTPGGAALAARIEAQRPDAHLWLSRRLASAHDRAKPFERLKPALDEYFHAYRGHVFIMSSGIVVRLVAPLLHHKTVDPAVVVADEAGQHVISLLSGHIGGANRLARHIAALIGGTPVITTATDVNQLPAIDVLAQEFALHIENPEAIKQVNMAIITGRPLRLHDPLGVLTCALDHGLWHSCQVQADHSKVPPDQASAAATTACASDKAPQPDVMVDDRHLPLPAGALVLRPPSLAVGIGCNRNTALKEIHDLLIDTFERFGLAPESVGCLASIDVKHDERALQELGQLLRLPLRFFTREQLNTIDTIASPSAMVEKHVGVKSVCEAAAILAARQGQLIVPKQRTRNATIAVARRAFTS